MPDKIVNADGSVVPIVAVQGSAAAGSAATSANATPTVNATMSPKGFQQIVGPVASSALTPPGGSRIALIQAEAQPIRWRDDGVAPTATVGMLLPVGSALEYDGDLTAIRFIQTAATATLNVSYYA